jgi:Suppressor of fused protein (SUFU)
MEQTDTHEWFESVWAHREEVLYPALFGSIHRGIFPIQAEMLTGIFKQVSFDPRLLSNGVFEFGPMPTRDSWLYVTSGMSNDWEAVQPNRAALSGLGCEFVLEVTKQTDWAIVRLLHAMIFQILLCNGRYPGREPLNDFDRIPLGGPFLPGHSLITRLLIAPPSRFPRKAQLDSGTFEFFQLVGISETEASFARAHGGSALLELLVEKGGFPVTDPDRNEVTI